jgi:hypothetical protein
MNGKEARLEDVHRVLENPASCSNNDCSTVFITRKHAANTFGRVATSDTCLLVVVGDPEVDSMHDGWQANKFDPPELNIDISVEIRGHRTPKEQLTMADAVIPEFEIPLRLVHE